LNDRAWFVAQLCCGGHTFGALALRRAVPNRLPYASGWPSLDLGVVYTGVAGLLNVLVLLDIIVRSAGGSDGKKGGLG
jgi:hypothetical protein